MLEPSASYHQRFREVARNRGHDDDFLGTEFLHGVAQGLHDWEAQYRRQLSRALIVSLVFITLAEASGVQISFAGVSLTDLSLPLKVLPVLFTYTMTESIAARMGAQTWRAVWASVVECFQPALSKDNLDLFMLPAQPNYLSEVAGHSALEGPSWRKQLLASAIRVFLSAATTLLPVAFLGYCYWKLFDSYGFSDALTWLSLIVSLFFFVQAMIILTLGLRVN